MPINAHPDYIYAEKEFDLLMDIAEKKTRKNASWSTKKEISKDVEELKQMGYSEQEIGNIINETNDKMIQSNKEVVGAIKEQTEVIKAQKKATGQEKTTVISPKAKESRASKESNTINKKLK